MTVLRPSEGTGARTSRPGAHKYTYPMLLSKTLLDTRQADVPFVLGHVVHDTGDVITAAPPRDLDCLGC